MIITKTKIMKNVGQHNVAMFSTVTSLQVGPGFDFKSGHFCVEFVCSPRVCVGSLRVLWLPPTIQKHAL